MSESTPASPVIPDLEFRPPECPLCGVETSAMDGTFDCESCGLSWSIDGTSGERMNLDRPQCLAQCMPHEAKRLDGSFIYPSLAGRHYICVLDAGHVMPHRGTHHDATDCYVDTHVWLVKRKAEMTG